METVKLTRELKRLVRSFRLREATLNHASEAYYNHGDCVNYQRAKDASSLIGEIVDKFEDVIKDSKFR